MRFKNKFLQKVCAQVISRRFMHYLDDIKLHIIIGITLKYKLVLLSHTSSYRNHFLNYAPLTSHLLQNDL